jgi:hypothetical protein
MALTPDIERAHAIVEIASLLAKVDIIRKRKLRDVEIHVTGWNNDQPGNVATVRVESFTDGIKLVDPSR